ncbi:MAG: hypothetical protein JXQ90_17275 [Cyclobacteriaceae bacterium]
MKGLLNMLMLTITFVAAAQYESKKNIKEQFVLDINTKLVVENINGDVTIMGTDGDQVELELIITANARSQSKAETALEELAIRAEEEDGKLTLGMKAPFMKKCENGWSIEEGPSYDYNYEFVVKVPRNNAIKASTVNNGDLLVKDIKGIVQASNVNGHVTIRDAKEVDKATTVNGYVKVAYDENPKDGGYFYTINGDIVLEVLNGFSAEVYSKSMNGEMFTSFDFEYLTPRLEKNESKNRRSTTYKVSEQQGIKIGSGGQSIKMETLNGNMYVKRI